MSEHEQMSRPLTLAEARAECDRMIPTLAGEERELMLIVRESIGVAEDDPRSPAAALEESLASVREYALENGLTIDEAASTPVPTTGSTPSATMSR